jgi:hypothetical protein
VQGGLGPLLHQGNTYHSSVAGLLKNLKVTDSVSTLAQKGLYLAQEALPWAGATLAGITLLAMMSAFYWSLNTGKMVAEAAMIEKSLSPPQPAPAALKAAYEKPLALADTLGRAQIVPTIQTVLAEVSASVSSRVTFDELEIKYPGDRPAVQLTLTGQAKNTTSGEGVPTFNEFISALRNRGYKLVNSELQKDIKDFAFKLEFERGLL